MSRSVLTYFIMSLFATASALAQMTGSAAAINAAQTGTATAAKDNFEEAEKRDKECDKLEREEKNEARKEQSSQGAIRAQASYQRQKKEREKKECEAKSAAKKGQGMGNLGQIPMQQMAQDQSSDSAAGKGFERGPEDEAFSRKLAAIVEGDPMDAYRDPVFGKELLTKSGLSPSEAERVLGQFAQAEAEGIVLDPQTQEVQTPFGSISAAALGSASGMKAMGFSNEEIASEIQKQQEDMSNLYKKVALASATGGGGGGFANKAAIDDEFDLPGLPTFGANSLNKDIRDGKRGYFQMTRNIAGGRIGVASDDIFHMVTRRYRKKALVNHFLP